MGIFHTKRTHVSPHRTKYEVWAEILESCTKTARTRCWLLSKLRLSTTVVKKALNFLIVAKLMEIIDEPKAGTAKYKTTAKGQEALSIYQLLVTDYFQHSNARNRTL
jgi:predicted transcriptional regulator